MLGHEVLQPSLSLDGHTLGVGLEIPRIENSGIWSPKGEKRMEHAYFRLYLSEHAFEYFVHSTSIVITVL